MQRTDFSFDLPEALIAHYPTAQRSASRLLCLEGNSGVLTHRQFADFSSLLSPGDLLVLNNTKVMAARLFGRKASGGKVELLIERLLGQQRVLAHCKASKRPLIGTQIIIADAFEVTVVRDAGGLLELEFKSSQPVLKLLELYGHIPLPPYIKRQDEILDHERYQTVYAQSMGSFAAPTAGLHFDKAILDQLIEKGVQVSYVTLHVGAGTFQPVRVDNLDKHIMHAEYAELSAETCAKINRTKVQGKKVIAVGTTSVRTLETASLSGKLEPFQGETRLFIRPGFQFNCVDAMVTNFHLPESTLLMLVCAFAGYEQVMHAYQEAIANHYRFFSYGDAMYLTRKNYEI